MSSFFCCLRLYSLSTFCRKRGNYVINLRFLLGRFPFNTIRPFSSIEEGKPCHAQRPEELRRSFVVSYLENSCGLPVESAEFCSKYVRFKYPSKPDLVLSLLRNYGFTSDQITRIVKSFPSILSLSAEKIISPKLDFFHSIGFSNDDLAKVVSYCPKMLGVSLKNQLIPCYNFLKSILRHDELVVKSIKRSPRLALVDVQKILAPKVSFLKEAGVTESCVAKLLEYGPSTFCLRFAKFEEAVGKVIGFGMKPSSGMFVSAFRAVIQIHKSTWDRKVEVYRKWGWSDDEFRSAFNRQPLCMSVSEKKIMMVLDFFVNKMGIQSSDVAKHPIVLFLSFEKRIIPRCSVMAVLYSKGILRKKKINYFSVMTLSEKTFLERFVNKHQEHVLDLWNNLLGDAAG